jgi:hypothetical protein
MFKDKAKYNPEATHKRQVHDGWTRQNSMKNFDTEVIDRSEEKVKRNPPKASFVN